MANKTAYIVFAFLSLLLISGTAHAITLCQPPNCAVVPTVRTYADVTLDPQAREVNPTGDANVYIYNISGNYEKQGVANAVIFKIDISDPSAVNPPAVCYGVTNPDDPATPDKNEAGWGGFMYDPQKQGCTDHWFVYCPLAASILGTDEGKLAREQCLNSTGLSAPRISAVPAMCDDAINQGTTTAADNPENILSHNELYFCNRVPKDYSYLCWPLMLIFAVLLGASFAVGRNPFMMFDMSAPRLSRGRMYTPRTQSKNIDYVQIAMAANSAVQSGTKAAGAGGKGSDGKPQGINLLGSLGNLGKKLGGKAGTGIASGAKWLGSKTIVGAAIKDAAKAVGKGAKATGQGVAKLVVGKDKVNMAIESRGLRRDPTGPGSAAIKAKLVEKAAGGDKQAARLLARNERIENRKENRQAAKDLAKWKAESGPSIVPEFLREKKSSAQETLERKAAGGDKQASRLLASTLMKKALGGDAESKAALEKMDGGKAKRALARVERAEKWGPAVNTISSGFAQFDATLGTKKKKLSSEGGKDTEIKLNDKSRITLTADEQKTLASSGILQKTVDGKEYKEAKLLKKIGDKEYDVSYKTTEKDGKVIDWKITVTNANQSQRGVSAGAGSDNKGDAQKAQQYRVDVGKGTAGQASMQTGSDFGALFMGRDKFGPTASQRAFVGAFEGSLKDGRSVSRAMANALFSVLLKSAFSFESMKNERGNFQVDKLALNMWKAFSLLALVSYNAKVIGTGMGALGGHLGKAGSSMKGGISPLEQFLAHSPAKQGSFMDRVFGKSGASIGDFASWADPGFKGGTGMPYALAVFLGPTLSGFGAGLSTGKDDPHLNGQLDVKTDVVMYGEGKDAKYYDYSTGREITEGDVRQRSEAARGKDAASLIDVRNGKPATGDMIATTAFLGDNGRLRTAANMTSPEFKRAIAHQIDYEKSVLMQAQLDIEGNYGQGRVARKAKAGNALKAIQDICGASSNEGAQKIFDSLSGSLKREAASLLGNLGLAENGADGKIKVAIYGVGPTLVKKENANLLLSFDIDNGRPNNLDKNLSKLSELLSRPAGSKFTGDEAELLKFAGLLGNFAIIPSESKEKSRLNDQLAIVPGPLKASSSLNESMIIAGFPGISEASAGGLLGAMNSLKQQNDCTMAEINGKRVLVQKTGDGYTFLNASSALAGAQNISSSLNFDTEYRLKSMMLEMQGRKVESLENLKGQYNSASFDSLYGRMMANYSAANRGTISAGFAISMLNTANTLESAMALSPDGIQKKIDELEKAKNALFSPQVPLSEQDRKLTQELKDELRKDPDQMDVAKVWGDKALLEMKWQNSASESQIQQYKSLEAQINSLSLAKDMMLSSFSGSVGTAGAAKGAMQYTEGLSKFRSALTDANREIKDLLISDVQVKNSLSSISDKCTALGMGAQYTSLINGLKDANLSKDLVDKLRMLDGSLALVHGITGDGKGMTEKVHALTSDLMKKYNAYCQVDETKKEEDKSSLQVKKDSDASLAFAEAQSGLMHEIYAKGDFSGKFKKGMQKELKDYLDDLNAQIKYVKESGKDGITSFNFNEMFSLSKTDPERARVLAMQLMDRFGLENAKAKENAKKMLDEKEGTVAMAVRADDGQMKTVEVAFKTEGDNLRMNWNMGGGSISYHGACQKLLDWSNNAVSAVNALWFTSDAFINQKTASFSWITQSMWMQGVDEGPYGNARNAAVVKGAEASGIAAHEKRGFGKSIFLPLKMYSFETKAGTPYKERPLPSAPEQEETPSGEPKSKKMDYAKASLNVTSEFTNLSQNQYVAAKEGKEAEPAQSGEPESKKRGFLKASLTPPTRPPAQEPLDLTKPRNEYVEATGKETEEEKQRKKKK